MANAPKVGALLAQTAQLSLAVNEGEPDEIKLDLKLAWTMRAVILLELKLREFGVFGINILQNPQSYWDSMDCTMLAASIWALAQQDKENCKDFDTIASFIVTENYPKALLAVKAAFLASLSDKRRKEIEAREASDTTPVDPPKAPSQA